MADLQRHFGKFGGKLYYLCRGIDERQVCPDQERKSVSVEETYPHDLPDLDACQRELTPLYELLVTRVKRANAERFTRKLFVKLRFDDFRRTTAECIGTSLDETQFRRLLDTAFQRGNRPVRLLGLGVRVQEEDDLLQLGLFGESAEQA